MNTPAQPKILVIDDEFGPRESLRMLLKKEMEVCCTDSVEEGLTLLKKMVPDVVVLDIRMPKCSGIDALRQIRQIDSNVSIIMLTGYGALETAQEALRLGANDYLKKPFDAQEMRQIIKNNIQRTQIIRWKARALEELESLNSKILNDLMEKDSLISLGQASEEIIHDLRNPLGVVLGYVQLLVERLNTAGQDVTQTSEQTLDFLNKIEESVKHCWEVAEELRHRGKYDPSRIKSIELYEVLRDVANAQEDAAHGIKVVIECDRENQSLRILSNRIQLVRAFQNLVVNAIQASTPGQVVKVICTRNNEFMKIVIEDQGSGITPENLVKIFDPYFTTKKTHGTGLGMVITKRILDDHHGSIQVESEVGKGTRVTVTLPLYSEDTLTLAEANQNIGIN